MVMSLKIKLQAALYPFHTKNMLYRTALGDRRGQGGGGITLLGFWFQGKST